MRMWLARQAAGLERLMEDFYEARSNAQVVAVLVGLDIALVQLLLATNLARLNHRIFQRARHGGRRRMPERKKRDQLAP